MSLAIAILLVTLGAVGAVRALVLNLKYRINAPAFVAQIQKLVLANNIDRAIKLCNAAPSAALASQVKALLTRANRTHELHLIFEQARYDLHLLRKVLGISLSWSKVLDVLGLGLLLGSLVLTTPDFDQTMTAIFLGVYVALRFFVLGNRIALDGHLRTCDLYLLKIRNLLYVRDNVVPASHRPRPETTCTREELEAWRESLKVFNTEYTQQRGNKGFKTPQEAYDAKADRDGVLRPL